ncbi:MAG: CHAT domain-containing tetratricopeptide repeat protein [Bacteroidota bacterium]
MKFTLIRLPQSLLFSWICFFTLVSDGIASGNQENPYYDAGLALFEDGNYQEACQKFRQARKFAKGQNEASWAKSTIGLAQSLLKMNQWDSAIDMALQVKASVGTDQLEHIQAYQILGKAYLTKADYPQSLDYLLEGRGKLQKMDTFALRELELAHLQVIIGKNHFYQGTYDSSFLYYDRALANYEKYQDRHPVALTKAYDGLGKIHFYTSSLDLARSYTETSLATKRQYLRPDHPDLITNYSTLGSINKHEGNYEKALELHKKALRIVERSANEPAGPILNNIAVVYEGLKKYRLAIQYYQKTLEADKKTYGEFHPTTAMTNFNMSLQYYSLQDRIKGAEHFNKAVKLVEQFFGKKHQRLAYMHRNIAHKQFQADDDSLALVSIQKALTSNLIGFDDLNVMKNPTEITCLDRNMLLHTLWFKADFFAMERTGSLSDLKFAFECYLLLDQVIQDTRRFHKNEVDRLTLERQKSEIYQRFMETTLRLYDLTQDITYLHAAFQLVEKSESSLLTEARLNQLGKESASIPEGELNLEQQLLDQYSKNYGELINLETQPEPNTAEINRLKQEQLSVKRRYDSLVAHYQKNYPNYHALHFASETTTVPNLQHALPDSTLFLEYFIADSSLYVFRLDNRSLTYQNLPFTALLADRITEHARTILTKDIKKSKETGYLLYKDLLAPVLPSAGVKKLIISPSGPLWNLNFELLLSEESTSNDVRTVPYLLKKYSISYANSANLLFNRFLASPEPMTSQCLAFSFLNAADLTSNSDQVMDLDVLRGTDDDLPGSREEIKKIAQYTSGDYFFGTKATEQNFKKNADKYNILHLALHGEINEETPDRSKLLFTPSETDSLDDGSLYAHEVYGLNIPAQLVVLSACNTGTGKMESGEGIMSLGRAFQYAGVQSLVLSRWEVADDVAPALMERFYARLQEGKTRSEALRLAKLDFLEEAAPSRTAPYYWGSFYLLGKDGAMDFPTPSYRVHWFVLVITCLTIAFFLIRKRRFFSKG